MLSSKSKGAQFEEHALHYLQQKGLILVQRNFHCRLGEIDLIMLHQKTLCFIEVKYRSNDRFGGAAFSIPLSNQRKINDTALIFLGQHKEFQHHNYRFDALLIKPGATSGENTVDWIENAFGSQGASFY